MNIKVDTDVKRFYNKLDSVDRELNFLLTVEDNYDVYWISKKDTLNRLGNDIKEHDPILSEKLLEISELDFDDNYNVEASKIKPYIQELYNQVADMKKELKPYQYVDVVVDYNYYKAKTVIYDEYFRYMLMSFHSRQELNVFLTNLQKGLKRNRVGDSWDDIGAIKNGYEADYLYVADENIGDGVHAKIYATDVNTLIVKNGENPVVELYNWLKEHTKVALLDIPTNTAKYNSILKSLNMSKEEYEDYVDLWRTYFFNKLRDKGLINECEVIDYTGIAPSVYVISEEVTPELIRQIRTEGIKNKEIAIPVVEEVELKEDMTFLEIIENFVLKDIQDEKAHYNIGEPISPIISSPIYTEKGKSKLYPRQQIIAQGVLNAIKEGKNSIIINGGTGVGKTYISGKLSYAVLQEVMKVNNGRVVCFAQGHLIKKWQRQINECLNPLGIKPKFYLIESYKDVKDLPKKPNGLEILLMPKDRAKRNYLYRYSGKDRINRKSLAKVAKFVDSIEVDEKEAVIIREVGNLPIHLMKLAARRLAKKTEKHTILLKEKLSKTGEVEGYKVVTTSKAIKEAFGKSAKAYDFEIKNKEDFIQALKEDLEKITTEHISTWSAYIQNGITCPECGSLVYDRPSDMFDEEKYINNRRTKPTSRSTRNNKCGSFIKADGTKLTDREIENIREGLVKTIYTEQKVEVPYVDEERNPLDAEEIRQIKAGTYTGKYQIMITSCKASLWEAHEGTGYRTVNAAEFMKRRFGKKCFDLLIADEVHLYAKESNQGFTFDVLCQLSKIKIGLTGTLTGGKASDIYYMLWRMMPEEMVRQGYRYEDLNLFIDHFGRRKKTTKEYHDKTYNKSGKGKKTSSGWQEIPGISPLLYSTFLAGRMVSRKLEDMGIPMPPIRYFKHEIKLDDELRDGYDKLKNDMVEFMKENEGLNIGGSYLHALLSYPDLPQQEAIYWKGTDLLIANPTYIDLSNDKLLNKEKKLLATIKREVKEGRRVLVYNSYSGKKGVSKRLMKVISEAGFTVAELTSNIKLEDREEWIEEQARKGVQVLLTNPQNVQTGLDIIPYPTIYFYNLDYDVKVVRQAEKRAWRPNQDKECRIYYSFYEDTLQEDAIKLIGSKKKESLALEGVFSEDMLSSMGSDLAESGSKILFNVLKGKVKLEEENLDAFGFESEEELEYSSSLDEEYTQESAIDLSAEREKAKQIDIFTITEDDIQILKKKVKGRNKKKIDKQVIPGQMSFVI